MKIISWNVNGIRAAERKGFLDWLEAENPDVVGVQEIKAMEEQLSDDLRSPKAYKAVFNSAERKGYSGTGLYTKHDFVSLDTGLGRPRFDTGG